jgi:hypothetical protein
MKIFIAIVAIVFIILASIQIFALKGQRNIETYPYTLEKKYEYFEIRNYEATLFTSVKIPSKKFKESSSNGFRILAGYIFGANEKNQKIPMTSPVSMSLEDTMTTMMFMVPNEFNLETLPEPNQQEVKFHTEPARRVAAITFGGWSNDEKLEKYKGQLKAALKKEGIAYFEKFYFFGYNAPYEMINRKNEIIVELNDEINQMNKRHD